MIQKTKNFTELLENLYRGNTVILVLIPQDTVLYKIPINQATKLTLLDKICFAFRRYRCYSNMTQRKSKEIPSMKRIQEFHTNKCKFCKNLIRILCSTL